MLDITDRKTLSIWWVDNSAFVMRLFIVLMARIYAMAGNIVAANKALSRAEEYRRQASAKMKLSFKSIALMDSFIGRSRGVILDAM